MASDLVIFYQDISGHMQSTGISDSVLLFDRCGPRVLVPYLNLKVVTGV